MTLVEIVGSYPLPNVLSSDGANIILPMPVRISWQLEAAPPIDELLEGAMRRDRGVQELRRGREYAIVSELS